jgi:hypothetical protein
LGSVLLDLLLLLVLAALEDCVFLVAKFLVANSFDCEMASCWPRRISDNALNKFMVRLGGYDGTGYDVFCVEIMYCCVSHRRAEKL